MSLNPLIKNSDSVIYNLLFSLFSQFYFTKELEDQHIKEKDNGIFVCETNKKKIPVDWFIDDKPVIPGEEKPINAMVNQLLKLRTFWPITFKCFRLMLFVGQNYVLS